ncbi:DUF2795 domain-containing protein [Streptomyces sp. TRM66268-LWL]|uniref:DUF2795 domain-containing protein n=1 Tax=Streptomyces polyasparticus TaxID=2767826 RepID=A0ABR7SSE5_9ACTN|nr:DUF2795 domain-containing protein [Streptomyces polyasparticus]MBC9717431.1 DUF2795 domain-containing protein [Streptomyces polyasparticus]
MSEHGRNKTGPLRDDEIKKRMQGELKGGHSTRAWEEFDLQPSGEDQPRTDRSPHTETRGSTPPGMTPEDVELRTELAQHLGRSVFPADRGQVVGMLRETHAPDRLIDIAGQLPADRKYGTVREMLQALGRGDGPA